jgi:hypothetical protein
MTGTDSLFYKIDTEDFYEDTKANDGKYGMSNFDCDLTEQYKDDTNKKVVGAFKDEGDGQIWPEFVGLRPKMYSASMYNGQEKKTGRGIKRDYLKKNIIQADYVKCIESRVSKDQQQMATFNRIRCKKHRLSRYQITKVGLCRYDNKQ